MDKYSLGLSKISGESFRQQLEEKSKQNSPVESNSSIFTIEGDNDEAEEHEIKGNIQEILEIQDLQNQVNEEEDQDSFTKSSHFDSQESEKHSKDS